MKTPNQIGYYWWRGCHGAPWQIVEIFEQESKLRTARCGRSWTFTLEERGGIWGLRLTPPTLFGYWSTVGRALLASCRACIEGLLAGAGVHSQTDYTRCVRKSPLTGCLGDPVCQDCADLKADEDRLDRQSHRIFGIKASGFPER